MIVLPIFVASVQGSFDSSELYIEHQPTEQNMQDSMKI